MSTGQIEQFYSRASSDPAILNKLMADTQTPDEFIDKAVALGAEAGFTFSRDEADAWIKKQIEAKASGELSDLQLEGVAGGKGYGLGGGFLPQNGLILGSVVGGAVAAPVAGPVVGGPLVGGPVGPWVSSW
jgi:predicted ribosomally synthesized peptide with nif11-like leader